MTLLSRLRQNSEDYFLFRTVSTLMGKLYFQRFPFPRHQYKFVSNHMQPLGMSHAANGICAVNHGRTSSPSLGNSHCHDTITCDHCKLKLRDPNQILRGIMEIENESQIGPLLPGGDDVDGGLASKSHTLELELKLLTFTRIAWVIKCPLDALRKLMMKALFVASANDVLIVSQIEGYILRALREQDDDLFKACA